jgi:regulator of protease activity HflC (stomatin/prohibitin superfamily)
LIACWFGFYMVQPNQGKVLQFFGRYSGTDRNAGLRWANPFYTKKSVSLRVRNFESGRLKVNDANGNPIEIGAVIVWRVVDTAEAVFEVDNYESYVTIQSEAALRNLATSYAYEEHGEENKGLTLRSNANEIALKLKGEVHERLQKAGVEVMEARLSHLAYSAEIAQAMLQRQQASAVLGARKIIVQGAVSIVQAALEQLKAQDVVELDAERQAAMVSNLLVVLCGDQRAQPIINAGSLY